MNSEFVSFVRAHSQARAFVGSLSSLVDMTARTQSLDLLGRVVAVLDGASDQIAELLFEHNLKSDVSSSNPSEER